MKAKGKHWKRLRGRWVLRAYVPWRDEHVFYKQKNMPCTDLTTATSWPDKKQAKAATVFMKRCGASLRWLPYRVKDTELFLHILK